MSGREQENKCSICGTVFALKSSLKIHLVKHRKRDTSFDAYFAKNVIEKNEIKNVEDKAFEDEFQDKTEIKEEVCSSDTNKFECDVCGKQFNLEISLGMHMAVHESETTNTCGICHKSFRTKDILKYHMKRHAREESFQCKSCGKCFSSAVIFKKHEMHRLMNRHQCSKCMKVLCSKKILALHKSQPCSSGGPKEIPKSDNFSNFLCKVCRKTFSTEDLLEQHQLKSSHVCHLCSRSFLSCLDLKTHMQSHDLDCSICDKSFTSKSELKEHKLSHKDSPTCPLCNKKFKNRHIIPVHIRRVHKGIRDVQCETCGKMFYRSSYKTHLRTHTGERPYCCKECGATFVQSAHLKTHMKFHKGVRDHQCDICGKAFAARQTLTFHYRTHTGERPYKCSVCFKEFSQPSSLRHHEARHFPSRYLACSICNKKFSSKNQLDNHYKQHSDEALEMLEEETLKSVLKCKSFVCQVCDENFKSRHTLYAHYCEHSEEDLQKLEPRILLLIRKVQSTGLSCDVCGKQYTQSIHLKQHMRIHTGERPYKCDICSKAFRLKAMLDNHLRIHTGERPFKCPVCDKEFMQKAHATVHMKTHTGKKPHACSICGKTFAHNGNRRVHEKTHFRDWHSTPSDKNTLLCSYCGQEFRGKIKFDNHLKSCANRTIVTEVGNISLASSNSVNILSEEGSDNFVEHISIKVEEEYEEESIIACPSDALLTSDCQAMDTPVVIQISNTDDEKDNLILEIVEGHGEVMV